MARKKATRMSTIDIGMTSNAMNSGTPIEILKQKFDNKRDGKLYAKESESDVFVRKSTLRRITQEWKLDHQRMSGSVTRADLIRSAGTSE